MRRASGLPIHAHKRTNTNEWRNSGTRLKSTFYGFNCISVRVFIHAWIGMCSHAECMSIVSAGPVMDANAYFISFFFFSLPSYCCEYTHTHTHIRMGFQRIFIVYGSHVCSLLVFVRIVLLMASFIHTHTCTHTFDTITFPFQDFILSRLEWKTWTFSSFKLNRNDFVH